MVLWLFGVLVFGLARLIGAFGPFSWFPISRFLVLPGAWAWVSPNCDRLAFARRAYRTAEGGCCARNSPASELRPLFFFVRFSRAQRFPVAAPSIVGRHTSHFRARALGPSHFQRSPEPPALRPGPQPCILSECNEALLPIGDRGKAAPGAVAVPRGDRGPTSPTIRAAYPVPTRGHCKCPAGRLKLCLD